jgi:chemotaxis protein MotB
MQISVIGHTDNRPIKGDYLYKFPSNWELSSARAAAVVRFFHGETGLDPKGFEVVGRSFYNPVASNETKEGRAKNRRVEVIIGPEMESER